MAGRLQGKAALITGAASGIGLATAEYFCQEGAAVTLADAQAERAEEVAARLRAGGHRALVIATDVTHSDQVRRAVAVADSEVTLTIDKRAHNPYLVASGLAEQPTPMPWFGNQLLQIRFA
jgi:NAD(P)-dependent dehydrogenase (short-subunit alcohol dehydrogenase family)